MSRHPLIERSNDREVRQAKGFRDAAAKLSGEELAAEYRREVEAAPRRAEAGRKFLVSHNTKLAAERRPGRDGEHAAIALVQWVRENGPLALPDDAGTFEPLHAGVALKSAQPEKEKGADDPNFGVGRLDLAGIGPEGRFTGAVVRYLAPDAKRVGTGDTPLRALLEGLAHLAIAEANREPLVEELASRTERTFGDGPSVLVVLGSPRYWELCRKREAQRGAAWVRELERLARELEEACGVSVHFLSLKLQSDPGIVYDTGAPTIEGIPRLVPAWEPGAGRVKPKPRPRRRKDSAQAADQVVEADLSRPVRPYDAQERYTPGDRIEHPTLGTGVVQGVAGPNKIRVLFDERKSLLVHDRGEGNAEAS